MRADLLLVEKGFATSRTRAQELIESGKVVLVSKGKRIPVKKSSFMIELQPNDEIEVEVDSASHFVSRGGLKMQGALERTKLNILGARVLDVGISTGGFSDCLLQKGARSIVGVDVGHGQLHARLKEDPRVTLIEGVNARDLSGSAIVTLNDGHRFDLIVVDVSFISLALVLPGLIQYLKDSGSVMALVKPQFEVGRENLGKNGIVKDQKKFADVEEKIRLSARGAGLIVEDYFESSIKGSDGNIEFFIWARCPELSLGLI
jgi:23S rRNA (cytidine1920-2'-O)/16S rRNA (cytidine1409-2'-O)-methyltransferase